MIDGPYTIDTADVELDAGRLQGLGWVTAEEGRLRVEHALSPDEARELLDACRFNRDLLRDRLLESQGGLVLAADDPELDEWVEAVVTKCRWAPDLSSHDVGSVAEDLKLLQLRGDDRQRGRFARAVERVVFRLLEPADRPRPAVLERLIVLAGLFRVRTVASRLRELAIAPSSPLASRGEPLGSMAARAAAAAVSDDHEETVSMLRELRHPQAVAAVYQGLLDYKIEYRDALFETAARKAATGPRPGPLDAVCKSFLRRPPERTATTVEPILRSLDAQGTQVAGRVFARFVLALHGRPDLLSLSWVPEMRIFDPFEPNNGGRLLLREVATEADPLRVPIPAGVASQLKPIPEETFPVKPLARVDSFLAKGTYGSA